MGMGEKTQNSQKIEYKNKGKIPRLVDLPPPASVYKMEADCFPVFENTENKSDLP